MIQNQWPLSTVGPDAFQSSLYAGDKVIHNSSKLCPTTDSATSSYWDSFPRRVLASTYMRDSIKQFSEIFFAEELTPFRKSEKVPEEVDLIIPSTMYIGDGLAEVLNCVECCLCVSHLFRFDIHRDETLQVWHTMSFHSQANFPKLQSISEKEGPSTLSICQKSCTGGGLNMPPR